MKIIYDKVLHFKLQYSNIFKQFYCNHILKILIFFFFIWRILIYNEVINSLFLCDTYNQFYTSLILILFIIRNKALDY